MAKLLNSSFNERSVTVKEVLESKGRIFASGFLDEFDREAMRAARAISGANAFRPHRPSRRSGFGKPIHHPNSVRILA